MKTTKPKDTATSRWLSFRPEIKVLDCTIRDGGLMNNHHFDDKIVKVVYDACVAAGIDYMELGYKASRKAIKAGEYGCWKYCMEEDLRRSWRTRNVATTMKIFCRRRIRSST